MSDETGVPGPPEVLEMARSSRDHGELRSRLEAWLGTRLAGARVTALEGTATNGMSSETLLFDAEWTEGGAERHQRLVARLAPDAADVPVFPRYDLDRQFAVIRAGRRADRRAGARPCGGPSPIPAPLGAPFFVMERVDGRVPPDVMPYNFGDNWLFDADPADQRRLQDATVGRAGRAARHRPARGALRRSSPSTPRATRRCAATWAHARAWYEFAAADGVRSPLVERGLRLARRPLAGRRGPTRCSAGATPASAT